MQHVSVNNWPEAARFNTKNHAWTPFRAFPRLFRKFPRLFREFPLLFLGIVLKKWNFTYQHGCKAMPQVAQGL